MTENSISVERLIQAEAQLIFDVLARPARHSEIDGSGTVQAAKLSGPDRLSLHATFGMSMTFLRLPYRISNVVVEFEENELIAWRHFGRHIWRYELENADQGTLVRESFDWSGTPWPKFYELSGYSTSHLSNMTRTLERLEAVVASNES